MRALALMTLTAFCVGSGSMLERAWCDEGEASVGVRLHGGATWVEDSAGIDATDRVPVGGISLEGTRAWSDWYEYRLVLGYYGQSRPARYTALGFDARGGEGDAEDTPLSRSGRFVRSDAGITLRLSPPPWTPIIHLGMGLQFHIGGERNVTSVGTWGERTNRIGEITDAVAKIGLGYDYRIDAHWIIGPAVLLEHSVRASERRRRLLVTFHISYYFYPRWRWLR